jgi:hypothetical protein
MEFAAVGRLEGKSASIKSISECIQLSNREIFLDQHSFVLWPTADCVYSC